MDRVEKLKEFLRMTPHDSFLQHALALEYIKQGRDEVAREQFEELLSRDPAYVGSYYHLGKLLERQELIKEALQIYEQGMKQAMQAGDRHAYGELKAAFDELAD